MKDAKIKQVPLVVVGTMNSLQKEEKCIGDLWRRKEQRKEQRKQEKPVPSCRTSLSVTLSLEMAMSFTLALASSSVTLLRSFFSMRRDG